MISSTIPTEQLNTEVRQAQQNLKDAFHDYAAKNADIDYTAFKNIQADLKKLNSDIYENLGPPTFRHSPDSTSAALPLTLPL